MDQIKKNKQYLEKQLNELKSIELEQQNLYSRLSDEIKGKINHYNTILKKGILLKKNIRIS